MLYNSSVLLYNRIAYSPKLPNQDTPPKPPSNQTPDLVPDKTGNNRNAESETTNALILPTLPPTNALSFKPFLTKPLILCLIKQGITGTPSQKPLTIRCFLFLGTPDGIFYVTADH
jgi:hypothetical protein